MHLSTHSHENLIQTLLLEYTLVSIDYSYTIKELEIHSDKAIVAHIQGLIPLPNIHTQRYTISYTR